MLPRFHFHTSNDLWHFYGDIIASHPIKLLRPGAMIVAAKSFFLFIFHGSISLFYILVLCIVCCEVDLSSPMKFSRTLARRRRLSPEMCQHWHNQIMARPRRTSGSRGRPIVVSFIRSFLVIAATAATPRLSPPRSTAAEVRRELWTFCKFLFVFGDTNKQAVLIVNYPEEAPIHVSYCVPKSHQIIS